MDPGQLVYFTNSHDVSEEVEINLAGSGKHVPGARVWTQSETAGEQAGAPISMDEFQLQHGDEIRLSNHLTSVARPEVSKPRRYANRGVLQMPLQASTQLILSNTTASFEHVNQLLKGVAAGDRGVATSQVDRPDGAVQSPPTASVVKTELRSPSRLVDKQKRSNVVKKILVLQPGEDPEKATAAAINQITELLNKEAALRMAQGRTPDKETVIEITRIKTPAEGYFCRENLKRSSVQQPPPSPPRTLNGHNPLAGLARLASPNSSPNSSRAELVADDNRKHHRRKSPLPTRYMYRTPSPPHVKVTRVPYGGQSHGEGPGRGGYFQGQGHKATGGRSATASSMLLGTRLVPNTAPSSSGSQSTAVRSLTRLPTILRSSRQTPQPVLSKIVNQLKCQGSPLTVPSQSGSSVSATSDSDSSQENLRDINKLNDSLTNIQWLGTMSGEKLQTNRDIRVIASEKQIDQISRECGRKKRPPYSYMHLIQMAICSKPDKKMTLKEIYKWIEDKFPYYKYCPNQGWKNSIRHNLSLYDIFVREKPDVPGRTGSSFWTLRADGTTGNAKMVPNLVCDSEHRLALQDAENSLRKAVSSRCASPYFFGDTRNLVGSLPSSHVTPGGGGTSVVKKKGPVPLLPKLPAIQTYALIPVQNGLPLLPSQPVVMSPLPAQSLLTGALAESPTPEGLSTPNKNQGFAHNKSALKRFHSSPDGCSASVGGPRRKHVKIAPKLEILDDASPAGHPHLAKGAPSRASCTVTSGGAGELSGLGASMDASDLGHQLSQMRFDSGFMSDTSSCDTPSQGLPRPKMYPATKGRCNSVPACGASGGSSGGSGGGGMEDSSYLLRTPSNDDDGGDGGEGDARGEKKPTILSLDGGSVSEAGLQDILSSIETNLSPSMRHLLQTPPKAPPPSTRGNSGSGGNTAAGTAPALAGQAKAAGAGSSYNTSTPFKEALASPTQWMSPIKGLTPITGDANLVTNIFTPPEQDLKDNNLLTLETTPEKMYGFDGACKSPSGSVPLPILCFPGYTPLKTPFKTPPTRSPRGGSNDHSPNDSFGFHNLSLMKLIGDIHLDSMLDEGINLDVSNMSFSALQ